MYHSKRMTLTVAPNLASGRRSLRTARTGSLPARTRSSNLPSTASSWSFNSVRARWKYTCARSSGTFFRPTRTAHSFANDARDALMYNLPLSRIPVLVYHVRLIFLEDKVLRSDQKLGRRTHELIEVPRCRCRQALVQEIRVLEAGVGLHLQIILER